MSYSSSRFRDLAAVPCHHRQEGAATLWIFIGVVLLIAAIFVGFLQLRAAPGPVTFIVFNGSVTAPQPFPQLVDTGVGVTYKVTTNTVTVPYGAGPGFPPTASTPPVAAANAVVVFSLVNGDATFSDGSTSKSVNTGANGLANVTIIPVQDGDDTLSFVMNVTTGPWYARTTHSVPDSTSFAFEVETPP